VSEQFNDREVMNETPADGAGSFSFEAGYTGAERGRGPGRRLSEFSRAAEEGELTDEQFLFVKAIDAFKLSNNKTYPSWTDVLEVVRLLGYRKTVASELVIRGAEDFTEKSNTPSNVRPRGWEKRFAPGGKDKKAA
jgi:hypothetical protein